MNAKRKPWIRWHADDEATGPLARIYEDARRRAGKVWNIVRVMSLRPPALEASMDLYQAVMRQRSEKLGRAEREMLAVVVSAVNGCHY